MFADADVRTSTARRGGSLGIACVAHVAVLLALVVWTMREPVAPQEMDPLGVTLLMAPQMGAGSPPPQPAPVMPATAAPIARPSEPVVVDELPTLPTEALAPVEAPMSIDNLPRTPVPAGQNTGADPDAAPSKRPSGDADSTLAPAIGAPAGHSNWAGLVLGRLERFRRYPSAARRERQEGIVYVRFTIDRQGHVLESVLVRTSGHPLLDREGTTLVKRADPLPPPPAELAGETITLTVPIEFFLTRRAS